MLSPAAAPGPHNPGYGPNSRQRLGRARWRQHGLTHRIYCNCSHFTEEKTRQTDLVLSSRSHSLGIRAGIVSQRAGFQSLPYYFRNVASRGINTTTGPVYRREGEAEETTGLVRGLQSELLPRPTSPPGGPSTRVLRLPTPALKILSRPQPQLVSSDPQAKSGLSLFGWCREPSAPACLEEAL